MKCILLSVFLVVLPTAILAENIFKINISPEEAQQYLAQVSSRGLNTIEYAPKTGENPLPEARNENGQFVYMGRVIENPNDYVEEHYDAHQYHGQDGLGQYVYGYKDWNQGKNEKKDASGTVTGTYKYVQPHGRDFIANYYADRTGFHVEDNRPAHLKNPPTKTPAVRKAEEEHFRLWGEFAAAAGHNPDPYAAEYQTGEGSYQPQPSDQEYVHQEPEYVPGPEEHGDPKGFFYAFDYNVPLLRNKKEREELEQLRAINNKD
ncbi:cuticular protein 67B [Musca autumnalis]|uniref:cuticular protein 67B n=1 Tax=Musca autumnalis TaxID=221902 RepID=UPI003CF82FF4